MATLSSLPVEMVENVARYLDPSGLLSFRKSCRHACCGSENTFLERFFSTRRHVDTHYSLKALIDISEHRYLLKRLKRIEIYAGLRLKALPGDPEDAERTHMRTSNFDTRLESMSWYKKEHLSAVDAAANDVWPESERASLDDFYSLSRQQQQQTFHPMHELMATVLRNLQRHNIVVELFAKSLPLKKWKFESGDDVKCGVPPFGYYDVIRKELGYHGRQLASSTFTMQCTRGGPALLLLSAAVASVSYPVQSFGLGGVHDLKRNEAYDHIGFSFAPMRTWPESILANLASLSLARTTTMLPRAPTEFTSQLCALKALHLDRGIHNRTIIRRRYAEGVDSGRPLKMLECQKAFGWLSGVRLEHLTLMRSWFVEDSLQHLLHAVRASLRSLVLHHVRLPADTWPQITAWMARNLALEYFESSKLTAYDGDIHAGKSYYRAWPEDDMDTKLVGVSHVRQGLLEMAAGSLDISSVM